MQTISIHKRTYTLILINAHTNALSILYTQMHLVYYTHIHSVYYTHIHIYTTYTIHIHSSYTHTRAYTYTTHTIQVYKYTLSILCHTYIYTHIPSQSGKASGSYETVFWSSSGTPKAVYISLVNPLYVI